VAAQRTFVVGTRGSRLALRQTGLVLDLLRAANPGAAFEVREVRTEGDRNSDVSLSAIGGQGVFVKEIEAALARGGIDLAVHSLKDVPADLGPGLTLAAMPPRADPRDALVARAGSALAGLASGARVGTGSARRAVQLLALRSDLQPADIRGNVDTRVRKVDEGQYDGAVLAVAGLERLGLLERATEVFEPGVMLPAVGQGALVIEARADDAEAVRIARAIDHRETRLACAAERAFLRRLGGGCRLPFGALAEVRGDTLRIRGFISDEKGKDLVRSEVSGDASQPEEVAFALLSEMFSMGAIKVPGTIPAYVDLKPAGTDDKLMGIDMHFEDRGDGGK
jgi:hydroxymethylbilane synthase